MDVALVRDWAIIILCLLNIVALLIAIAILWVLYSLVRGQLFPLFRSLRRTVNTVEGTTAYLSRTAVSPVVRVAGLAVAASRFAQAFRGSRSDKKGGGK